MSMEKNLKEFLEELIQEVEKELDEATATGAVAGYQTPMAFSDKGKSDKKRKKKIATSMGYSVVGNDVDNISEASDSEIKKSIKKKIDESKKIISSSTQLNIDFSRNESLKKADQQQREIRDTRTALGTLNAVNSFLCKYSISNT